MTRFHRIASNVLPALLAAALALAAAAPARAQASDQQEIKGKKSDYEKAHGTAKTILKKILTTPIKNPVYSKLADELIDTAYDEAKKRWADPSHARDMLRDYRNLYYEVKTKAFEEEQSVKHQLADIDHQLTLPADKRDTAANLLQRKRQLQARAEDLDHAIGIVDKRLENADRAQKYVDRGLGLPPGFDDLANDFKQDFGDDQGAGEGEEDVAMSCEEIEAEERRIETELKNEVVGRGDAAALGRIQAAAAVLQELRAQKKNCKERTASGSGGSKSHQSSNRTSGPAG